MEHEDYWRFIEAERRGIADLLDGLSEERLDGPSLCADWRIRDVAAHLACVTEPSTPLHEAGSAVSDGESFHELNRTSAVDFADELGSGLADFIRERAGSRLLPALTDHRNTLFDVLVHGQDIAVPLGIPRTMPVEAARAAADQVWAIGFPFSARERLRGLRLTAEDTDWTVGEGTEVRGPMQALLMTLTGRTVCLDRLTGPGAPEVADRHPVHG
ncbi:maleylpyruvate isomerase family mycothiol-dependent enzyme [Nocardiopsis sp. EMB25]|uniref:maleylpyruvate isomerase family mycothiol-dependent enzyme n=1 Tax=Nocardiopsis sp. EMB25 TaxID=2835867 RepID=UPI0022843AE9|nr:maleylpyruvate isomerase family mycothiol-dependent enzyme [Nocardiopsis sp. EMB25]MCY9786697.1 maleylpyruvate isomerase family mycothiol-dependent enzyme [Nocardiopsis sp. EMB25]